MRIRIMTLEVYMAKLKASSQNVPEPEPGGVFVVRALNTTNGELDSVVVSSQDPKDTQETLRLTIPTDNILPLGSRLQAEMKLYVDNREDFINSYGESKSVDIKIRGTQDHAVILSRYILFSMLGSFR